jgi:hypothetical protein
MADAWSVSRRQQHDVDTFSSPVHPDHAIVIQRRKHRPAIQAPRFENIPAVTHIENQRAADDPGEPARREVVEAGSCQPVVDVATA